MSKAFFEEIKIGSTFDAKGFKQAESALTQMNKTFKTAAKTLGISYGTAALLAYAKGAVKAAAEDQRATNILANNLKNVGLAYAAIDSEKFIQNMQTQTGILDDSLRPAFAKLASTTGSIAKTQELMSLAFDASNGSGVDFASTIDILSKAYVGNTKGLKQLNLGLTSAELTSMSFAQIQKKITEQFSGAGKVAIDSYAGQLQILSTAATNAQETIGYGLLEALKGLTGQTDVQTLAEQIGLLATNVSLLIEYTGKGFAPVTGFFGIFSKVIQKLPQFNETVAAMARYLGVTPASTNPIQSGSYLGYKDSLAKAAEDSAKKRAAEILKIQQGISKAKADQLKLTKAAAMFDLKKIGIAAALKGNISADARNRLLAMQAIENGNADLATKYSAMINPNASMNVNVHVAGSVTSATDLVNTVRKGLLDANVAGQQTNIRRTGTTAMRAI